MKIELKDNEVIDDLQLKGMKIIQSNAGFKFGIDAVLLANFIRTKKSDRVCDLGTGTGIIPLLIAGKSNNTIIDGIEIQDEVAEMANRSVIMNGLEDRITIHKLDIKEVFTKLKKNSYAVVSSNPPYMIADGIINDNSKKAISRHEIFINLEELMGAAAGLLFNRGKFFMVHRPNRLADIIFYARKHKLEPKLIRFVHSKSDQAPKLVLIEFLKGGNAELRIDKPLIIYNKDGSYRQEIIDLYGKESIDL